MDRGGTKEALHGIGGPIARRGIVIGGEFERGFNESILDDRQGKEIGRCSTRRNCPSTGELVC
jgi:hypothetical protein